MHTLRSSISFFRTILFSLLCIFSPVLWADPASDMGEMQKKLNQETVAKPFAAEDAAKIDSYISDAMRKDLKPNPNPPDGWRPDSTCDSYYYNRNNYNGYRDCLYYQRYYGHYW